jgi:serine/threonine-protein kinase
MIGRVFLRRYVVTSALGQGSMGRIYLANDQIGRRTVVLKLMSPHLVRQPKFRQQFQQELDCMRRLSHPAIVALLDGALDDPGGPCLVLEHIRGMDLEYLRKRQPGRRFNPERIGRLVGQLCEALHAAHQAGIVHRDLKPANLMVVDWAQPLERIKVMDFGLARWAEEQAGGDAPGAGGRPVGAAGYISPEQVRGDPVNSSSDLYSLGVVLFELLTGKLPFRRETVAETLEAHLNVMPPRFAAIDPALQMPAVEAVVQCCLAKTPSGRPANALDLGQRLEEALGQSILGTSAATAPAPPAAPSPAVQRSRPTLPGRHVQRPSPSTFHDRPPPEPEEATCSVPNFSPDAGSLACLAGFVKELGGRLVEKGPDSMRALLPVNLDPAAGSLKSGGSSGNVKLILTELELHWEPRRAQQDLRLEFRPLGAVSVSLANAWRHGCERVQAQLEAYLQS